jgi:MoaA/NifB/PqqE/SkfB family radical SAM enzyme
MLNVINPAKVYRALHDLNSYLPKRFLDGYALPPMRVAFVLTHACNLKCYMCNTWVPDNPKRIAEQLTADEIARVIEQIPRYSLVTFTGGEIYLRKDLREVLTHAASRNRIHLVTNGTRVGADEAEEMMDLAAGGVLSRGLVSVGVSIDGLEAAHDQVRGVPGAFQKSIGFLRTLVQAKRERHLRFPVIDIKVVITPENIEVLPDLYSLGSDIGVDLMSFQILNTQSSSYGVQHEPKAVHHEKPPAVPAISGDVVRKSLGAIVERSRTTATQVRFNPETDIEHIVAHYENRFLLKDFGCTAVWSVMHVGPHGDVFPCYSYNMGNVREMTVQQIWNGEKYRGFRRDLKAAGVFPGCIGCCVMKFEPISN